MAAHEELEAANAMGLEVLDKLFAEPSEVGTRFEGRLAPGFLVRAMTAAAAADAHPLQKRLFCKT